MIMTQLRRRNVLNSERPKRVYKCKNTSAKLAKLRLTSFEGNPSMLEFILEFTASSFIDKNCKSNL